MAEQMKVAEIDLPIDSLIYHDFKEMHYCDVFQVEVITDKSLQKEQLIVDFFDIFPVWFKGLLEIRNVFAKFAGLNTGRGNKEEEEKSKKEQEMGERIGFFKVLDQTEEEIYMGENDKHLNFRVSVFLKKKKEQSLFSMATTVHFNNWLGRVYFVPVKIVHRLVVPLLLKRAVRKSLSMGRS